MDRRQFLRWMAGLGSATAAGLLLSCDRPQRRDPETPADPDPDPNPLDDDEEPTADIDEVQQTRVAVIATDNRADGVHQALALLARDFDGKSLFLKPNFNSADPPPGSTHNAVLRALVRQLQDQGAQSITVGDRSGMGDTQTVMEQKQIFSMAETMGFDTMVLDDLAANQWELIENDDHWHQGFALPRPMREADAYVQTCCLKTHRFGGHFTMALKNNVGLVAKRIPGNGHNFMGELHDSEHQRLMIAEINQAISHDLIVLDAVEGFYEQGPDKGPTASFNAIIAGTDPVAIEALGVALLRRHGTTDEVSQGAIAELEQIRRAIDLGVGTADPEAMRFLTPDEQSQELVDELVGFL